jgi:hypothetical protein
MPIRHHDPSTLGRIDAVDVVALDSSVPVGGVNEFIRSRAVAGEIRLTDVDAEHIAALWRSLPSGEQARCHIPPYGLRFWLAGRKVLEASICWECDNVYGYAGDETLHFPFDSKAPVSVSLLMQCRHVLPARGGLTPRGAA